MDYFWGLLPLMHLEQKISLKPFNTFGMNAVARYFIGPKTQDEILSLLHYRNMVRMPILILGGGSNLLFTKDFDGLAIRIGSTGIVAQDIDQDFVAVTAEAGEPWDGLVRYCVDHGYAGLENLSLIPGTVGAAPIQNIGAYGVEAGEWIESVQFVDIETGTRHRFNNIQCDFGYRNSVFKKSLKGQIIILEVTFRLRKTAGHGPSDIGFLKLDYGQLREGLNARGIFQPTLSEVREVVCDIRREKLPDPGSLGNAGSFFKNPVIPEEQRLFLLGQFPAMPWYPEYPQKKFPGPETKERTRVKIPAAWLIEQCGWKGYRNGDAGVYPRQPLVLVNYGNATGMHILELKDKIITSVLSRFGILLEPEVCIL